MEHGIRTFRRSGILTKMVIFMLFIGLMPLIISAVSIKTFNDLHQKDINDRQEEVVKKIAAALNKEFVSLTDELRTTANEARPELNGLEFLAIADDKGEVLRTYSPGYEVPAEAEAENLSRPVIFQKAVSKNGPVASGLKATMKGPMISVVLPVAEGRYAFAVVNVADRLKRVVEENSNPSAGEAYLTDQEGRLLVHGERELVGPLSLRTSPLVGSLLYENNIKTEGQKRYVSFWQEQVIGSGDMVKVTALEQPIGTFIELDASEADFIFGQLVRRFTLITILLMVLTLVLSFYLTLTLVRPIRELERGTERAAQGKLDQPVSIKSGDELEDLGRAFNDMMQGLKQLAELREEFVFVAAHELRAPVGIIKGYLSLLLEGASGPLDPAVRGQIEKVVSANERLVQLIEDLLEVSRDEAGRLEIKVSPISIIEPVQKVVTDAQKLASDKKIKLAYSPGKQPQVLADPGRIGEIVMNLVSNAIKYSPEGSSVTVGHSLQGKKLQTWVKDNGFGISAEAQKKLFQKFYRVQTEKTAQIQGTGLGLFIAKRIVEKMGGEMWVVSKEGEGSTFTFTLPLA